MNNPVPVLPVHRLVEHLGRLERQQKSLGLYSHAHGLRLAIECVQVDAAEAWLVEPPAPGQSAAAAIGAMVASLTTTSSTTTPPAAAGT